MHVAIVGNGISGITAARTLRKLDAKCRISVISAESKYFFSRTALMYIYMGHMKFDHTKPYEDFFWEKNRIDLIHDHVVNVDFEKKQIQLKSGDNLDWDKLLIATGSKPNMFNWPGQDLKGVQGLYSLQDLELLEKNTHKPFTKENEQRVQQAVIVGGGLIGVELAEMLLTRNIAVTFLIREKWFWGNVLPKEEAELLARHFNEHGVSLKFNTELSEIKSDSEGRVKSVITSEGEEIKCEFVGLTAGVSPNVDFLKSSVLKMNRGILVSEKLETNIPNVFAAGDCAEFITAPIGRNSLEQVWYTGRMMGEVAGKNMAGKEIAYQPGPWFNSAKFFDIEYQTYGKVDCEMTAGVTHFYWEDTNNKKCLKIQFREEDKVILGINVFGIRLRHELMHTWLENNVTIETFLQKWSEVNFNQEFSKNDIFEIVKTYNLKFQRNLKQQKKKWLDFLIK